MYHFKQKCVSADTHFLLEHLVILISFFYLYLYLIKSPDLILKSFFIILFLLFVNSVLSQENNVNWNDIIQKNKIFYKKNEATPFNGKVFGSKSGIMKYGIKSGIWKNFYKTNITESIGL